LALCPPVGGRALVPIQGIWSALPWQSARACLAAAELADLPEDQLHQVLRHCRQLVIPGGELLLQGTPLPAGLTTERLAAAAWLCGFTAHLRCDPQGCTLQRPARQSPTPALVSILIPAYKSRHFEAALASALAQTHPRCEVVVCDDSPDDRIAEIVVRLQGSGAHRHLVRYVRNRGNVGGRANYLQCFELARGEHIKYLNDDDLLAADCVAKMSARLSARPEVTLVTSYRRLIDEHGRRLPDQSFNRALLPRDGVIDGRVLATIVLAGLVNVVGEPTTTMFRRQDVQENQPHLMSFAGRSARKNGDLSIWTTLLARGDAFYCRRALSCFRQHDQQVQRDPAFLTEARLAWQELAQDASRTGLLSRAHLQQRLAGG
jgi:hypothetical protein